MNRHIKGALIVVGMLVICIGVVAWLLRDDPNYTEVTIKKAPSDATVNIDNKTVKGTKVKLKKNTTYTITASRSGFDNYLSRQQITDQPNQYITVGLSYNNEEGRAIYEREQQNFYDLEAIAGQEASATGETMFAQNPILAKLPYKSMLYTIGYKVKSADNGTNSIILTINAPEQYRQSAIAQIVRWGVNPGDYDIEFYNYESVFNK